MPTTPPTITTAPTPAPDRSDRSTFSGRVDAFVTWLIAAVAEFGAVATNTYNNAVEANADAISASADAASAAASALTAVNAPGTSGTSTTSETIGSGAKSLTIQTGKEFVKGMTITAADSAAPSTNQMRGIIDTYTTGTGVLTFTVSTGNFIGSGTKTAWTVSLSPAQDISNTGTIDLVATGAIATGEVVRLMDDGTVEAVSSAYVAGSSGTNVVYESASTTLNAATFDSLNNRVVVAYRDTGNSSFGTAVVGTVAGDVISFGTPVVFESAITTLDKDSITFDSTNNKIVIAYSDAGNGGFGTAVVGTVSGTAISFGTPVVFESASTPSVSATFDSTAGKVVISYSDAGNSNFGTAVVGTVSGTAISYGTPVAFNSSSTAITSITFDSLNNKVIIGYRDAGNSNFGTAVVGTVSGTAISYGTPVVFNEGQTSGISLEFDSLVDKVVIAYEDDTNALGIGTAIVGTVSGTAISYGDPVVFENANTSNMSISFNSSTNTMTLAYVVDLQGVTTSISVRGNEIDFSDSVIFESGTTVSNVTTAFDSTSNKTVIAYTDGSNSSYGTTLVFNHEISGANEWIGVANASVLDAETGTFTILSGVNVSQSGLTVRSDYYIQADGTLDVIANNNKVGRAISATELLVTGDS